MATTVEDQTDLRPDSASQSASLFLMINTLETGGSERQFAILARSLDPQRFQLHLGCIKRRGPMAVEFADMPEFWLGGSLYGFKSMAARFRLRRHLRERAVQIAHAFDFYTNLTLVPAARLAGVPVVIGSHRQMGDLLTPRQFQAQAMALRCCDAVVCNSHAAAARLAAARVSRSRLAVIGNAVSDEAFEAVPPALPRQPGYLRVCMVSRMNASYKNHRGFLRIAARVLRQVANTEFVLVGEGPLRQELEQYAVELGIRKAVTFLGERRDMAALLASMDLAVLTSDSESLSNVILEAMAARLPVIAYEVGGNSELIAPSRGVLVPAGNEEIFTGSVIGLLADTALRRAMGENGFRFVKANFALNEIRRRYQELYLDLLQRKRRRNSA